MKRFCLSGLVLLVVSGHITPADKPAKRGPKEALQAFNNLIGQWKGTGTPEGTRDEKANGLWTESMNWRWQFKGEDAWLLVSFGKSKHFARGELRYLADKNGYQLSVLTPRKETLTFTGQLQGRRLTLGREDKVKKEDQQLVFSFLHSNRFLYSYQVKPQERGLFTRVYKVGATKKGVPFAITGDEPACVVSGGLGTMKVTYKGKTYYVCCSGCASEFKEHPDKYVKEFEEKQAKKKK